MKEAKCHKCDKWVGVDSVKKDFDIKVKEIYWWKHAAACHGSDRVEGEEDFYVRDDVHERVVAQEKSKVDGSE